MEGYSQLVDRFYEENEYLMAPQQYEAAKKDFEYLIRLLELAEEYHKEGWLGMGILVIVYTYESSTSFQKKIDHYRLKVLP